MEDPVSCLRLFLACLSFPLQGVYRRSALTQSQLPHRLVRAWPVSGKLNRTKDLGPSKRNAEGVGNGYWWAANRQPASDHPEPGQGQDQKGKAMGLGCKCGIHPGPKSISESGPKETGHSLSPEALMPGGVSKGCSDSHRCRGRQAATGDGGPLGCTECPPEAGPCFSTETETSMTFN